MINIFLMFLSLLISVICFDLAWKIFKKSHEEYKLVTIIQRILCHNKVIIPLKKRVTDEMIQWCEDNINKNHWYKTKKYLGEPVIMPIVRENGQPGMLFGPAPMTVFYFFRKSDAILFKLINF